MSASIQAHPRRELDPPAKLMCAGTHKVTNPCKTDTSQKAGFIAFL